MKKAVVKLVAKTFCNIFEARLPPSGRHLMRDFVAASSVVIDAMPDGGGPDVGAGEALDAAGTLAALEWLFASLAKTNIEEDWRVSLMLHSLRLFAVAFVPEIVAAVSRPVRTLDSGGHKAL